MEIIKGTQLTDEQITKLESAGFRRWTKHGKDRLYANAGAIGLELDFYKSSGMISSSMLHGEPISHSQARKILDRIDGAYIDVTTGSIYAKKGGHEYIREAVEAIDDADDTDDADNAESETTENAFLALDFKDTPSRPKVVLATVIPPESLTDYAEWFRTGCVSTQIVTTLPHLVFSDYADLFDDDRERYHNMLATVILPITPEERDRLKALSDERAEAERQAEEDRRRKEAEAQAAREARKQELLAQVDSWETTEETITDEGGKTKLYRHKLTAGGRVLTFIDRNVFDFGRVINPDYDIADGVHGGLCVKRDGKQVWLNDGPDGGWIVIRELDELERTCMALVTEYGPFARAGIRM